MFVEILNNRRDFKLDFCHADFNFTVPVESKD